MSTKSIAAVSKPALITKDWQGKTFTFREDGYFNMTKAAKEFGKYLQDFVRSVNTHAFIDEISKTGNFPPLTEVIKGRYGATWGHPKLAVKFACWLDVRFEVACMLMIEDILKGSAVVTIEKPEESSSLAYAENLQTALAGHAEVSTQLLGLICQQSTAIADLTEKVRHLTLVVSNPQPHQTPPITNPLGVNLPPPAQRGLFGRSEWLSAYDYSVERGSPLNGLALKDFGQMVGVYVRDSGLMKRKNGTQNLWPRGPLSDGITTEKLCSDLAKKKNSSPLEGSLAIHSLKPHSPPLGRSYH